MGINLLSEYFQNIIYTVKTMISGMNLTWDHFINKKKYVSTLQYPNEKWPQTDRKIGFNHKEYNTIRSRLHVDIDDCIGCLQCERACPVNCIKIDTIKPPKDREYDCGKTSHDTQKKMIVPRFSIDMSECMYCNLCAYPCPEECIYMVGGPNEAKHEIDYEFSKYVKHDLVFEFSNVTDQEIIDIGGESYLEKRKEIENKISEGNELKGAIAGEGEDSSKKDEKKSSQHVDPGFVVFKVVEDKMSRGIAKKAYTYGRRNNMDMVAISKYVEEAINSYKKMTPEMEEAIKAIVDFKYPDDSKEASSADTNNETTISSDNDKIDDVKKTTLFDIKILNDISDKMIRGSIKKIYMGGKRLNKKSNEVIKDISSHLIENNLMNDEIQELLNTIEIIKEDPERKSNNKKEEIHIENTLFDIKLLNSIDDKVIRGTAKKVYMTGKREKKNSSEVIENIKKTLKESDKMNSDIDTLLKEIE